MKSNPMPVSLYEPAPIKIAGYAEWKQRAESLNYKIESDKVTGFFIAHRIDGEPVGAFPSAKTAYRNASKHNDGIMRRRIGWLLI